ncbi:MAG: peptidyl-prolyl cis-trans isomerase [Candidatus Atribacteria bacterium]|nr:peptidyl-prolyl cis-trans isomerase [Candidatus Atribacteria bacterium]
MSITNYFMKKYNYLIHILIIAILLISCNSNKNKQEISDEIVLKIGQNEQTKYEFERNKERTFNRSDSYQKWMNNYIDEAYFLADALDQKYDTLSTINKIVKYASYSMIGRVDGYLWQKVEDPKLSISNTEIKECYKRQNKLFYIETLKLPDKETLTSLLKNDTLIKSEADLKKLISSCKSNNAVQYLNQVYIYPYNELEFAKEFIYEMKPGTVSDFQYTNSGIYMIHLLKVEDKPQKSFEKEKELIKIVLLDIKKKKIADNKQKEVLEKANTTISEKIADELMLIIKNKNDSVLKQRSDTIMTFTFHGQRLSFLLKDFYDYYKFNPFMNVIDNEQNLIQVLNGYVEEVYLFAEAENLGVTDDQRYRLDRKFFKNRLIVNEYLNDNFYKRINITDAETKKYYEERKQEFSEGKVCEVSLFYFEDLNAALENYEYINSQLSIGNFSTFADTSIIKGLEMYKAVEIDNQSNELTKEIVRLIFDIETNRLSIPIEYKNNFLLFIKTKEEGKRIKTYDESLNEVTNQIRINKIELLRQEKLGELRKKYSMEINKL